MSSKKCLSLCFRTETKLYSELMEEGVQIPDFQRLLDKSRVEKMFEEFVSDIENTECLWTSPDITIAFLEDVWWVLDGQHRLHCFRRLYKEKGYDVEMLVKIPTNIKTKEDVHKWFNIVNKATPLPKLPKGMSSLKTPNDYANKIREMFPTGSRGLFSPSLRHKIPRLNLVKLVEEIAKRHDNSLSLHDFEKRVRNCNLKYSKKSINFYCSIYPTHKKDTICKALDTCRTACNNCYLGMIKYFWLDEVYGKEFDLSKCHYKKDRIPQAVRAMLWEKHFGNSLYGRCFICDKKNISAFSFEAGHDKAESKGGKPNLENLYPICSACNRSQSTKTFKEIKKYFS